MRDLLNFLISLIVAGAIIYLWIWITVTFLALLGPFVVILLIITAATVGLNVINNRK